MIRLERFLDPERPVSEIASTPLVSCTENERIRNAVAMILNGFSRIMVLDRGEMRGVVTGIDVLDFLGGGPRHQLYAKGAKGLDLPVRDIMSRDWHALGHKSTAKEALGIFHEHGREFHPVLDRNRFSGLLSEMDFIRHVDGPVGIRAEEVMDRKPIIARSDYSVPDAARMLCRGEFRFMPVVKDGFLMGVITPYDMVSYLNRGPGLNNLRKADFPVTAAMNRDVRTVDPGADLYEAAGIMGKGRASCVPVTDEGYMVGLLSRRDILDLVD
jgi:CBS domain-containing protein